MSPASEVEASRVRLARAQAGLVAALVAGAPAPPGFDEDRVRIQADALVAKRRDVALLVAPGLAALVGPEFRERFDAYARACPKPAGGAHADVEAFLQSLPEELRPHVRRPGGLRQAVLKAFTNIRNSRFLSGGDES